MQEAVAREIPLHQCINAACGCNDGISAGGCSEWCMANTTEAGDLETGKVAVAPACSCGHELCLAQAAKRGAAGSGTEARGMS